MTEETTSIRESAESPETDSTPVDFIRKFVTEDMASGRFKGRVHTRFPPEPNGYLHIGHAKAISIDFGIAEDFGGLCNLRFDDTNPIKEDTEYVDAIQEDVRWLGFDWGDRLFYASDYFEQLYDYAVQLVKTSKAYVCDLSEEETREYRGTLTKPGENSPYRDRSVEENLDLFERMRAGEFEDGARVLRAKIDMASPNINMRDPVMYRIRHVAHQRTGDKWCLYPMYDWAHGLGDSIEGVTHSLCDLAYEDHRPLYDWFLDQLGVYHPRQLEFARLNITYTILSKRKLIKLVQQDFVRGWDDPRMPTLSGMRRRGYTPEAILDFCNRIGVAKSNSVVDIAQLDHCVRDDLNKRVARVMAVLRPLRAVIDNYPEDQVEEFDADNNPEDASMGTRKVPFSRTIYIERDDFREDPPKKWFRLAPGREVRLKHTYYVTCQEVIKDETSGEVNELRCRYDPESRGGSTPDGRRVRGTLHWVSAAHSLDAEVRMYDHLFTEPSPESADGDEDFSADINPDSLEILTSCKVEPSLARSTPGSRYQFLRLGYFCTDPDSASGRLVFNRTATLRDTWAKIEKTKNKKK